MTDLEQRSGWLGRLSQWGVGLLFCLLSFIALVLGVVVWWKNGWYWLTALTGLAVAAAAAVCCWKGAILAPLAERYWRPLTALALLLCLVVKSGWILTHAITPQSDYATFHNLASALAEGWRIEDGTYLSTYVPLFPHIFGYSSFLSLFYGIFGTAPAVATWVNVGLSLVSCLCLLRLGQMLGGRMCGLLAALFWTVLPSQTVYNMFVLSEPYYTCLLLLAAWAGVALGQGIIRTERTGRAWGRTLAAGVAVGVLLALVQAARPIAVIGLVMLAIWLFFLCPPASWRRLLLRLGALALVCVIYVLGGVGRDLIFESRIGIAPAQGVGYSVAVGLNTESGGRWNAEDGQRIGEASARVPFDPEEIQEELGELAWQRADALLREPGAAGALLIQKLKTLLAEDSACISYAGATVEHPVALSGACTGFWLALWLLAGLGALRGVKKRQAATLLPGLFCLGLTLAQLLVEVAGRYHYSMTAALVLLAAVGALPWMDSMEMHSNRDG